MSYLGTNKIGKMYLGSTAIGKAYLGSNLVFRQGGVQPVMIPYIRGGADGSYIDTGITPDNTTRVIVWGRNFNQGGQTNVWLFGSRVAYKNSMFDLILGNNTATGAIAPAFGNESLTWINDAWRFCSHYHKYEMSSSGLYIDDVQIATVTASSFSSNLNLHLFGYNSNGTHIDNSLPVDICACKIYKGGVLVRDFTPTSSPSVGLLDAVSGTVFTNAGSGSFTYGSFNENAYTPLLYVNCDGQQYFDSGLYGTGTTMVVSKFRPTGTTKTYYRLYGTRNSEDGNTLMTELMIGNTSYANRIFIYRYKGAEGTIYNSASQTNNDLVFVQNGNSFALYKNNSQLGAVSATSASFTTKYTMYVGSSNMSGSGTGYPFYGYIYYIGFGADKNFVPAKVNNVAGMYDTYNDVFYPSISGTDFIAGSEL